MSRTNDYGLRIYCGERNCTRPGKYWVAQQIPTTQKDGTRKPNLFYWVLCAEHKNRFHKYGFQEKDIMGRDEMEKYYVLTHL
jgi:hypothetical protein